MHTCVWITQISSQHTRIHAHKKQPRDFLNYYTTLISRTFLSVRRKHSLFRERALHCRPDVEASVSEEVAIFIFQHFVISLHFRTRILPVFLPALRSSCFATLPCPPRSSFHAISLTRVGAQHPPCIAQIHTHLAPTEV